METLSRVKKNQTLRNTIENDREEELVSPALSSYAERLNKINPMLTRSSSPSSNSSYQALHSRREQSLNLDKTEPNSMKNSIESDYINEFLEEVRNYNLKKGYRTEFDTDLEILNQHEIKEIKEEVQFNEVPVQNEDLTQEIKKIIENDEVILNVPVDIENHVEYIVLRNPNQKSVKEIALECVTELKKIRNDSGSYMSLLRKMASMGKFRKFWFYFVELKGTIPFLRNCYGNFPVSNFGSFHIANGILALSSPMVAGLCIGELHGQNGRNAEPRVLTATLCFNHCVFDGNYGGRFLNALKNEIENGACFS